MLIGFIVITHKGDSKEAQCINIQYRSALSDVLTTGKCII